MTEQIAMYNKVVLVVTAVLVICRRVPYPGKLYLTGHYSG
jgi:hypothetical protein